MPEATELFLSTFADLVKRWNRNWPLPPREYVEKIYDHVRRTGIFEVAEVDGKMAAICHAVVRDHLWFLSGFWTLPEFQGQKIGRPLLQRIMDQGQMAGASVFFTWSSIELQAMASYMKMGMLPGYQALTFTGEPRGLSTKDSLYETQPLELATALEIDERIRETRREADHHFWISELKAEGRQFMRGGRIVGYYYFNAGTVGPAAWLEDVDAEALLQTASRDAAAQSEQIRLIVPGINHIAIRFALRTNLKITGYGHLLTSAPFGQMNKYLTSGPFLF